MAGEFLRLSIMLALIAPAAACAGVSAEERATFPAWFNAKVEEVDDRPFPRLAEVPTAVAPVRPIEEWREIERELRAAGRTIAGDPRNVKADTAAAEAEARAAREALDTPRGRSPS